MQLAEIKSLKAVETTDGRNVDPTRPAIAGSALWEPAQGHLIEHGPDSMAQLAPTYYVPNASPSLLRPLSCSLALTSCRKYVALRETLLKKASADFEPAVVKKKRAKKRRYRHKRKRRPKHYD
jgi:hypothetical protein